MTLAERWTSTLFLQNPVPPRASMFLTAVVSQTDTLFYCCSCLCYYLAFFLIPWHLFYAAVIPRSREWQSVPGNFSLLTVTRVPYGPLQVHLCQRSVTGPPDTSVKTLSFRFLNADAVSLGFVQTFCDFEHTLSSNWAVVPHYFLNWCFCFKLNCFKLLGYLCSFGAVVSLWGTWCSRVHFWSFSALLFLGLWFNTAIW